MSTPNGRPLAVVTGASSGIGRDLVARFAEAGFDLVIAAEDDRIAAAASSLAHDNPIAASPVPVDLATYEGVEELWQAIQTTGRTPDAVAFNAGVGVGGDFARVSGQALARAGLCSLMNGP